MFRSHSVSFSCRFSSDKEVAVRQVWRNMWNHSSVKSMFNASVSCCHLHTTDQPFVCRKTFLCDTIRHVLQQTVYLERRLTILYHSLRTNHDHGFVVMTSHSLCSVLELLDKWTLLDRYSGWMLCTRGWFAVRGCCLVLTSPELHFVKTFVFLVISKFHEKSRCTAAQWKRAKFRLLCALTKATWESKMMQGHKERIVIKLWKKSIALNNSCALFP